MTKIAGSGSICQSRGSGSVPKCHGSATLVFKYRAFEKVSVQVFLQEISATFCYDRVVPDLKCFFFCDHFLYVNFPAENFASNETWMEVK
jgi:hypothetical protein